MCVSAMHGGECETRHRSCSRSYVPHGRTPSGRSLNRAVPGQRGKQSEWTQPPVCGLRSRALAYVECTLILDGMMRKVQAFVAQCT